MTNKIPEAWADDILNASYETLWDIFNTFIEPTEKDMKLVKYGIELKFPIHKIIDEEFESFPKKKKIRVLGYGMCDEDDFKEEKDARKKLMLKAIAEQMNDDPTASRSDTE